VKRAKLAVLAACLTPVAELPDTADAATAYCLNGTMADGTHTRSGSVANNSYRLGTRIRVSPPVFGIRRWIVRDRIGWGTTWDFWTPSCWQARQFGRRNIRITIGW
jgi:3D (Asp-Asp-Asp) domain-containing protein